MKRFVLFTLLITLAVATLAYAQSGSAGAQASGQGQGAVETRMGNASANASASAEASADVAFERLRQEVRNKGAKVSAEARARAEARLQATADRVDAVADQGPGKLAGRLAAEFGMTAEALMAEKSELGVSWGQLMIAHTLEANTEIEVTLQQLFAMRQEGMGWGQIAAGLGLELGEVVSAVNAESRVASGQARADGKVAVIHGEGARAGVGAGARVDAGLKTGENKGASVGVGLKVGGKIKP